MIINQCGREWEEFDSVRAQALIPGPFALLAETGEPLCGRWVDGEETVVYTASGWKS